MIRPAAMRIAIMMATLLALAGCEKPNVDRSYAGTARYRYQLGMEDFEDGEYLEAINHFTFVKNKFAYSQYAALAELRIADSHFQSGKYAEAIDAYRTFIQGRPNHREVPYAMYRIGLAHLEQMPSNFFLFPPAHEKDQAATKDALRALQQYVERFPQHENVEDARKRIRKLRESLADHELYVARFYLRQDRPASARGRLEGLVAGFEDTPEQWTEAAWLLVEVYRELELPKEARATAQALIEKRPRSGEADRARRFLGPR